MDPRVITTLKWSLFVLISFVAFVIGSKHYKKYARKEALAAEMRTLISEATFYRSISEKDAQGVFLQGVAMIDEAKSLGMEPSDYFDQVFKHEKQGLLSIDEAEKDHPVIEKLARKTLIRGYQHAVQLDLLSDESKRRIMADGEFPDPTTAPIFSYIIDPKIAPGLEKVVPNLELKAPGTPVKPPNDLEITAALVLASDLQSAQIIDYDAEKKIVNALRPKPKN